MKVIEVTLMSCAILIIFLSPVFAGEKINLKTLTFGGLGFLSSYYLAHEGSHLLYATATGVEGFRFTSITGNWWADETPSIALRLAGLTGQALYSEGILALTKRGKRGPFLHGALLTNIVWEFTYPLLRGPDLDILSNSTVNIVRLCFGAHALFTAYRAYWPKGSGKLSFLKNINVLQDNSFIGIIFRFKF